MLFLAVAVYQAMLDYGRQTVLAYFLSLDLPYLDICMDPLYFNYNVYSNFTYRARVKGYFDQ